MAKEKFVTRGEAGIRTNRRGDTFTPSGDAARRLNDKALSELQYERNAEDRRIVNRANSRSVAGPRTVGNMDPTRRAMFDLAKNRDVFLNRQEQAFNSAVNNERMANSLDVTARDATNARIARQRLAGRAAAAKATKVAPKAAPKGGGIGGALSNPMLGVAASMYEADRATGFRRTKYSGNSGGPSFTMNPYAKTNYSGQSPMSKMMGVKK
jgi:hypothetical protein